MRIGIYKMKKLLIYFLSKDAVWKDKVSIPKNRLIEIEKTANQFWEDQYLLEVLYKRCQLGGKDEA